MLFLGAGASAPFGIPTSNILTKEIRELLGDSNEDLLDKIDQFHEETRGIEPNYEEIIAYLTALTRPHEIIRDHYTHGFARKYPNFKGKQEYAKIIDQIYNIVCTHCNEPFTQNTGKYLSPEDLESKFQMTYDAIIGAYLSVGKQDLIFSTNYDPSLEIWCQKRNLVCIDGTQNLANPEVKKVKDETSLIADAKGIFGFPSTGGQVSLYDRVALIRLHGSIWCYDMGDKRIKFTSPEDRRLFPDVYREVLKKKPNVIFPGQEDRISGGQWDVLYQYFKENLSGYCLFAGYSFRHDALNRPILENLKSGEIAMLGILAPRPDELIENLFRGEPYPKDRIVMMPAHVGNDGAIGELVQKWFSVTLSDIWGKDKDRMQMSIARWREERKKEWIG